MTIVVTGGGSGGHITPILAVAHALKQSRPDIKIVYIGQKGDLLADIPARDPNIDEVYGISAGKLRRYHGEGLKQLLDVKTLVLNLRDAFRVVRGIRQSRRLLKRLKPEIIFIKGGFVGVPVGLAASRLHIPFITHDSDAVPGLANRIISRWAVKHAVALPAEVYDYSHEKTVSVGIPLVKEYTYVTPELKQQYHQDLGLPADAQLLFIIGGGLGAQRINKAVVAVMPELLKEFANLHVVHGAGRANEAAVLAGYTAALSETDMKRVRVKGFLDDVYRYSGAADVVITRAGATNLAEFAVQGKACIVIPSPFLSGGHQLKNVAPLQEKQAVEVVDEATVQADPQKLQSTIADLLRNRERQQSMGKQFTDFGHPQAAEELAKLLLTEADAHKNDL